MASQYPPDDPEERDRFAVIDPHLRDEVGGLLEKAFEKEGGALPFRNEEEPLRILIAEAQEKIKKNNGLIEQSEQAARLASEAFAASHSLEDMETLQRWEAEAAGYRRVRERLTQEVERLSRSFGG